MTTRRRGPDRRDAPLLVGCEDIVRVCAACTDGALRDGGRALAAREHLLHAVDDDRLNGRLRGAGAVNREDEPRRPRQSERARSRQAGEQQDVHLCLIIYALRLHPHAFWGINGCCSLIVPRAVRGLVYHRGGACVVSAPAAWAAAGRQKNDEKAWGIRLAAGVSDSVPAGPTLLPTAGRLRDGAGSRHAAGASGAGNGAERRVGLGPCLVLGRSYCCWVQWLHVFPMPCDQSLARSGSPQR